MAVYLASCRNSYDTNTQRNTEHQIDTVESRSTIGAKQVHSEQLLLINSKSGFYTVRAGNSCFVHHRSALKYGFE